MTKRELVLETSLWELKQNGSAIFSHFSNELSDEYRLRLREIGLDGPVEVVCLKHTPFEGPRLYQICDGVFSLDHEIASQLFVQKGF